MYQKKGVCPGNDGEIAGGSVWEESRSLWGEIKVPASYEVVLLGKKMEIGLND